MNNINCQNLVFFCFQYKSETQVFTINKTNIMKKSKYQQYFHCFIVCIPGPCAYWFSFQQNIAAALISAIFRDAALIRGDVFIRGRRLFQCGYPKVRSLLESRHILEEIRCGFHCFIDCSVEVTCIVTVTTLENIFGKNK